MPEFWPLQASGNFVCSLHLVPLTSAGFNAVLFAIATSNCRRSHLRGGGHSRSRRSCHLWGRCHCRSRICLGHAVLFKVRPSCASWNLVGGFHGIPLISTSLHCGGIGRLGRTRVYGQDSRKRETSIYQSIHC